jgi:hypothetical protein
MLTQEELRIAQGLYRKWFRLHPGKKNPSDVNKKIKWDFWQEHGWESLELCQRARKCHTSHNDFPYPWTRWIYWQKQHKKKFVQKELL